MMRASLSGIAGPVEEGRVVEPVRSFVVPPDGGRVLRGPAGGPTRFLAGVAETGGTFTLVENTIGPGQGPPQHLHAREDEMWFVREGDLRFIADGEILAAPEGSFVFVPRRTPHCFQNIGDGPATVLVMFTPAGMERFFERHAELPDGPVDPEAYARIAHDSWMEVVGPPLGTSHPL